MVTSHQLELSLKLIHECRYVVSFPLRWLKNMKDQDVFMGNQYPEMQEVDQDRRLAHQNSRKLRLVDLAEVTCQDPILQASLSLPSVV